MTVEKLYLYYRTRKGSVKAVDGVSFKLYQGETLAIVGETGCGKSSLARALIRLLPRNVEVYKGKVLIDGEDVMKLSDEEFRVKVRWRKISMVFQGAMNSLNPVLRIDYQVAEPLMVHLGLDEDEALERAREMLLKVGIPKPLLNRYPFELSGGMRQRVVIAMALIANPKIVILDEPTSALDVITQANIMNLLKKIKRSFNLSYIFITHDLALASELADRIAVMYAGQIVEVADAETFYSKPAHPYAQKLSAAIPRLRGSSKVEFIPGLPPSLINPPPGCRFAPRCPYATEKCRREEPPEVKMSGGRVVKCWLYA